MQKTLKQTSQTLAIAIAAFALTITSAQAFGNHEFLTQAGLSDNQVVAVQEARELRRLGDVDAARDVLLEAGIDEEIISGLRQAHQKYKQHHHHWLKDQLSDKLTEEQRDAIQVAREANDREAIRAILYEAGIERNYRHHH